MTPPPLPPQLQQNGVLRQCRRHGAHCDIGRRRRAARRARRRPWCARPLGALQRCTAQRAGEVRATPWRQRRPAPASSTRLPLPARYSLLQAPRTACCAGSRRTRRPCMRGALLSRHAGAGRGWPCGCSRVLSTMPAPACLHPNPAPFAQTWPLRSAPSPILNIHSFPRLQPLEAEYPEALAISLFPQLPPWRSEAVTEVQRAGGAGRAGYCRQAATAAGSPCLSPCWCPCCAALQHESSACPDPLPQLLPIPCRACGCAPPRCSFPSTRTLRRGSASTCLRTGGWRWGWGWGMEGGMPLHPAPQACVAGICRWCMLAGEPGI